MGENSALSWTDSTLIRFPPRASAAIFVCRERDCEGWLTLAGAHGWAFGSISDAREEALWLSANTGLPVRIRDDDPERGGDA